MLDYGKKGQRGGNDDSPSLDRVEPSLGYIPSNVVVLSFLANRIKNSAESSTVIAVAEWLREREVDE